MKLNDFWFDLPADRIARFPRPERDGSRLMVVERGKGRISHAVFADLPDLLSERDFLVVNNSRVIPARLFGRVGAADVEVLVVRWSSTTRAEVLAAPARKLAPGVVVDFEAGLRARVLEAGERGRRWLEFERPREEVLRSGYAPLPPYIKRKRREAALFRERDLGWYQTVYAQAPGSIAAPTAGLHFSPGVLSAIRRKSEILEITLDVGEATFQKIEVQDVEDHRMGRERIRIPFHVRERIETLRGKKSKRLLAVGTTSVRSLETLARDLPGSESFSSELFIYPGHEFRMVDRILTNFHLPASSLFILVSAFAGVDLMREAYRVAVTRDYRFFSYGDAMLIL